MQIITKLIIFCFIGSLAHASTFSPIEGEDGIEIYKILRDTLQVKEDLQGNSQEGGCYNIRTIDFMGMECESASCTSEETYEREFLAGCYFDNTSKKQMSLIQNILKESGLSSENAIFDK